MSDILSGNSTSLRRVASDIPRDLETIINKAMSHSPDARYQTAQEFEADLNRYLQGKPVLARRISSLEVAWRWCLRNRAKASLFGLLTALLFAFAVGGPVVAIREAKRAREQAAIADRQRHEAYDAAMGRAHDHIEHGEIDQAVALLKEYLPGRDGAPEDYRSFEWFELAQRCQRRLEALEIGTTFPVAALAVSLNGDIAAAPFDNGPVVFDAQTGARKWPLEQRAIGLRGLAFSADGRHLISVGVDGQLKVWDATSGSMLFAMELASEADSVTAIADGTIAVGLSPTNTDTFPRSNVVSIEKYQILDGETGIDVKRLGSIIGPRGGARSLASSPDGQLIAAGSEDGILRVWNISTGDLLHEFAEFGGPVRSVAFSPSGSLVCGGGGIYKGEWLSGEAIVYDVTTRHKVVDIHPKEIVEAVIFPTDDQFATAGSDHNISLWRTDSGEPVERINSHADKIGCLAFESTSRSLISGSEDNFVRVWKLNERMPLSRVSKTSTNTHIHDLAFSPNNQLLASVSDDRSVRLWNPKEGSLVKTLGTTAHDGFGIDFSPDGKQLVTISSEWPVNRSLPSELAFWNVDSGVVNRFPLPKSFGGRSVAFAPSGKHVAVADNDGRESGRLFLWNIAEARVEKEIGSRRGFHVEFSQDGQLITTPGGLWTYPTLNNVFTLPSSEFACDISPDNMLFVASDKKSNDVVLYSANSGEEIKRLRGHKDIVIHASFSHDGRRIVTAGQRGIIVIWNVETGNEIVRYRDHQYWVWCAQFSHDDRVLASALGGRSFLPGIVIRRALDEQTARTLLEGRQ